MVQTPATPDPYHDPVLRDAVVRFLLPAAPRLVVDATFGGGGHARALLEAASDLRILGIDRDPDALAHAPVQPRLRVVLGNFAHLEQVLGREIGDEPVGGVLLDLGVSSHQLDTPARGFSYHRRGPLDMRMGPDARTRAETIVNEADLEELVRILRRYGEERHARRIAAAIVAARPIEDTARLAAVVAGAVPAPARRAGHPARRVFQALRIAVNAELDALVAGLDAAIARLAPGGRIVVIAYHSLEDRIVKRRFVAGATGCVCPPGLPVCTCGHAAELRRLTRRPLRPTPEEVARNPRARSARLRAAEKRAPAAEVTS